jgi:multiple sugar transport system permease protein
MSPARRGLGVMLAPYAMGLVLLVGLPAAATLGLAFFEADLVRAPKLHGLGNFSDLLGDEVFRIALRNSLLFAAWLVPLRVAGAFGLALLMHRRFRGSSAARTSVFLPTVIPDVAYALVWLWILNPVYGPLNLVLGALGLPEPAWLSQPGPARAGVLIMTVFQLGEGFVIALAARQMIPRELEELAAVEGAGAWQTFRRLTLPILVPALLLMLLRDTIFAFQASFVPALIVTDGGPPPYSTTYLPLFVYRNAFEFLRYGYASAATMVMIAITAAVVWLQFDLVRRWRRGLLVS